MESNLELESLYQCRKELQQLVEHPGWKRLEGVVQAQVILRRQEVFAKTIGGLDACFELARLRGEVGGMQAVLALPSVLVVDANASIAERLAERRADKDRQAYGDNSNPADTIGG